MICKPRLVYINSEKIKHTENQVLAVLHKLKEKDIVDYQSKIMMLH
jgi:hypothetical protein